MPPPPPTTTTKAAASKHADSYHFADAADSSLSPPDVLRRKPSAGVLTTSTTAAGKRTARITTTATVCPAAAAAPTTHHAPRHPLRLRDQNATSALRTVKPGTPTTKSPPAVTAARMPPSYERPSVAGHRQPTVARAVNKPPVTPKIAARTPAPQHQAPTLATPLARRTESTLSINGNGPRDRDELASPVSAFLSTNVTPRSGSRQTRVDSANSTPNGTPNPDRLDQWETRSGLGLAGATDDGPRRPVVTFSSPSEVGNGSRQDRDSKFFYASDAPKPAPQPVTTRPSALQLPKSANFFYANANNAPERPGAGVLPKPFSPPLASPSSQESSMSKFIYANGVPELQPPAKIGPTLQKSSGSVVSTASRVPLGRHGNPPRATSPNKPSHITPKSGTPAILSPRSPISAKGPQASSQLGLGKVNNEPPARPKSHARTRSAVIEPLVATRRVSAHNSLPPSSTTSPSNPPNPGAIEPPIATRRISSHGSLPPSGSTSPFNPPNPGVIEPPIATRRVSAHSSLPPSGTASPCNPPQPGLTLPSNPATTGFASLLQAAEDFAEQEEVQSEPLESPTKTSQDGQVTELVANARRERRVQDLEIRNGSLEAINRTLERQLRKQTAELRRYQRLSRSGRLSLGSMGSRIPSGSTVDGGGLVQAGVDLNDLSEEESDVEGEDAELDELDDELEEEDDLSSSEGSVVRSPSATALRQEKERRDERRLQLDLSKHQQLLVDSQKINQSLKRCLGWTEELIKEGRRALEYQVQPGDVELGGRVLAPEEVERREREGEGAEDTTLGDDTIYAIDALGRDSLADADTTATATTTTWSKDAQDRDSGIELPADSG